jgi:hypothetical protein
MLPFSREQLLAVFLLGMPQDGVLAASGLALLALWRQREHGTRGRFA